MLLHSIYALTAIFSAVTAFVRWRHDEDGRKARQVPELRERLDEMEKRLAVVSRHRDELLADFQKLKDERDMLARELQVKIVRIGDLENRIDELERRFQRLSDTVDQHPHPKVQT
jgi:chromosome segregation ATPase